jgi:alginate O-acetyltransferase complex protein AlgI
MDFNFIGFIFFLSIVFILYWSYFKKSATSQNLLIVAASLFFYGWMDWRFLSLLIFSTLFNFFIGKGIYYYKAKASRYLLYLGLIVNIGVLFYFKYFNFFLESFIHFFGLHEKNIFHSSLNFILPLGLSFFTFQAIGYLLDIYNDDIKPDTSLLSFSTFITYFPKTTAGPIERAERFLRQIEKKRIFDYDQAVGGMRQILWGLFTKLVIANNCGSIVDPTFDDYLHLPASTLLLGAFFFAFQIYCDFSGYSNIAIGISRLFGIQLTRNFASPFLSTNIRDFWRKWHISLSAWMMHYIFFPLSFTLRRYHKTGSIIAIMVTFLIIGLWHGANWTFIVFGALHGIYFIPLIIFGTINKPPVSNNSDMFPRLQQLFKMFCLFMLIMLTMIIFRADSLWQAAHYINRLFSFSIFSKPTIPILNGISKSLFLFLLILLLMTVEWIQRNKNYELEIDHIKSPALRMAIYYTIVFSIFLFGSVSHMNFIYSQF